MLTLQEAKFIIDGKLASGLKPNDVMEWVSVTEFESEATANDVENYVIAHSNGHKSKNESIVQDPNALPRIIVSCRNTKEITADAIVALGKKNNPPTLFMRGGLPVRISKDERGTPFIEVLNEAAIRGRLDRAATFVLLKKLPDTDDGPQYQAIPTAVPRDVVQDVMTLPEFRLPALENVTEIPTLRADGSILNTPGYDPVSKLYYVPAQNLVVPAISENPTSEQIREAVALINEVYIDFPYDSQASRANVIAATATLIYRPMIDGNVPLFITSKPQAGCGAGLATEALCMITTGRAPAMFGAPRDEDEWAKVIFAAVKAGQQLIIFDNCDGTLYSSNLARLITAKTIAGRILGKSENAVIPNNSMIFSNGNNLTVAGDIQRRSFLSRMETIADRPWERECNFLHSPLIPWVKANQGRIVAAYLTIAKAWMAAGSPQDTSLPRLGSFEEWQRVIGGILKHAGIEGFLGNREIIYQISDTESQQWQSFTEALAATFPEDFIVADVANLVFPKKDVEMIPQGSDLNNALPDIVDKDPRKFSKSLGHALIKKKDVKWHNGLSIFNTETKRHSAVVWKIVRWRNGDQKEGLSKPNSPPPESKGSQGELALLLTHMENQNTNLHIDSGKTNYPNSPLGTKIGELAPKGPKRLENLDPCPACGGENIGAWPDGTPGYYCMDCFPTFNQEVE